MAVAHFKWNDPCFDMIICICAFVYAYIFVVRTCLYSVLNVDVNGMSYMSINALKL